MACNIRKWKVSYYTDDKRKWVTGQLTLSATDISFVPDQNEEQSKQHQTEGSVGGKQPAAEGVPAFRIQYTDIKQVQKATSMLIYPAVTVMTRDGNIHWFSSLPDKYSLYNMLHHFAHQSLTGESTAKAVVVDPASRTRIGQQLLHSAEDSERTLAGVAAELWHQGRQLANASIMVQEMHEDLDVADRLLSGLNTWLGRWHLPPEYKQTDPVHIGKGDIPSDQDYEVLCAVMSKSQWHPQQLCILRTAQSGISVLDTRQRPLHSMHWVELARVFVVSPWEVVLTKHVAGKADVSVSVVSATLLPVLQLLQARVPHLVDYQTPPKSTSAERDVRSADRQETGTRPPSCGQTQFSVTKTRKTDTLTEHFMPGQDDSGAQAELQCQKQEEISDAELRALSSHLGGLKMLATAVGEEVTTQNKALDDLNTAVNNADSRIQEATCRMKRLM